MGTVIKEELTNDNYGGQQINKTVEKLRKYLRNVCYIRVI